MLSPQFWTEQCHKNRILLLASRVKGYSMTVFRGRFKDSSPQSPLTFITSETTWDKGAKIIFHFESMFQICSMLFRITLDLNVHLMQTGIYSCIAITQASHSTGRNYLKMTVFWDVAPCSLVEVYRRYRGGRGDRPDDGGKHVWNVGKLLPDDTVLQPRRQPSVIYHRQKEHFRSIKIDLNFV
jgi:hypothetical protein